jgi:DNA-binding transcriptional MerR regulator
MRDLKIGELANTTGTPPATIRYYERVSLMPRPRRGLGRQRLYAKSDVERLAYIRRCRALGFTLEEIRAFVRISAEKDGSGGCQAIVVGRLTAVRARLQELRAVESKLEALLARGKSSNRCAALEVFRNTSSKGDAVAV